MDLQQRIDTIATLPEVAKYPLSLRNEEIIIRRVKVPLDLLKLDPNNQRIQFLMTSKGFGLSEEEIEAEMWSIPYVRQLADSIMQNGGLLSPLIAKSDGTVVEGNSRTVALRALRKRFQRDGKQPPQDVLTPPVEILPVDFDGRKLLYLLGEWHIAGKHQWDPYEQAEFIYRMWREEGSTYDALVNMLRMSKSTIRQKIGAYELMKEYLHEFLKENREPKEIYKWSYFEELFKKKELLEQLNTDLNFKNDFFELVKEGGKGKFEGMNVRKLPEVIKDPVAWEVLKSTKDFNQAIKVVDDKKINSALHSSVNSCLTMFESVELKEIFELQQIFKEDQEHPTAESIRKLYDKIQSFSKLVGLDLEFNN